MITFLPVSSPYSSTIPERFFLIRGFKPPILTPFLDTVIYSWPLDPSLSGPIASLSSLVVGILGPLVLIPVLLLPPSPSAKPTLVLSAIGRFLKSPLSLGLITSPGLGVLLLRAAAAAAAALALSCLSFSSLASIALLVC